MLKICFSLILAISVIVAQEIAEDSIWKPFEYFIGTWEGNETGKSGMGKGRRTYRHVLDGQYILSKNTSTFEPQEKNPEGEVHEDWTFYSYDKNRRLYIIRQFNSEGFINQLMLDSLSADKRTFIFISEDSENAPPGLKARLTFNIQNENEFVETFELAFPGKEFSEWLKNHWKRISE